MSTATAQTMDPRPETWALWPDGTMCEQSQIEEMLSPPCAMSDDYMLVDVLMFYDDGTPALWANRTSGGRGHDIPASASRGQQQRRASSSPRFGCAYGAPTPIPVALQDGEESL